MGADSVNLKIADIVNRVSLDLGVAMAISPLSSLQIATKSDVQNKPSASVREQNQKAQNSAIMESQLNVSMQSGNEPLALLYKTAIEAINEQLAPELGEKAAQKAYDSGLDVSPEATAERIVKGATGFFTAYQEAHPELDSESAMTQFMSVIRGGIDKGFEEAKGILESLKVLEGEIAITIDMTYEHVQTGLQSFVENYFASLQQSAARPAPEQ